MSGDKPLWTGGAELGRGTPGTRGSVAAHAASALTVADAGRSVSGREAPRSSRGAVAPSSASAHAAPCPSPSCWLAARSCLSCGALRLTAREEAGPPSWGQLESFGSCRASRTASPRKHVDWGDAKSDALTRPFSRPAR